VAAIRHASQASRGRPRTSSPLLSMTKYLPRSAFLLSCSRNTMVLAPKSSNHATASAKFPRSTWNCGLFAGSVRGGWVLGCSLRRTSDVDSISAGKYCRPGKPELEASSPSHQQAALSCTLWSSRPRLFGSSPSAGMSAQPAAGQEETKVGPLSIVQPREEAACAAGGVS